MSKLSNIDKTYPFCRGSVESLYLICESVFLSLVALVEECFRLSRESDIGENILVAGRSVAEILSRGGETGLKQVSVAAGYRLLVAENLLLELLVYLAGSLAVFALDIVLDFLGDVLVPLTREHVCGCLNADHLAHRGDERRITEVFADSRSLCENFVELVELVLSGELSDKVREHSAGDLIVERVGLGGQHDGVEQAALESVVADGFEEIVDFLELRHVERNFVALFLEDISHGLCGRLRGAVGEAGDSGVDNIRAGFNSLLQCHRAETRGRVSVNDNGETDVLLYALDKIICCLGIHDARHVLDAHGLNAHALEIFCELDVAFDVVDGARGVADGARCVSAALDSLVNGGLDISQVVERIEYTDDVDAVFNALSDEKANDIVGIMLVAQKVLTSEEHLQLGVRARLADLAQALPRIFVEISQAGVERSAAPALERIVARLVKLGQYCLEILIGHTGRDKRLVRVSEDSLSEIYFHIFRSPLDFINLFESELDARSDVAFKLVYSNTLLLHRVAVAHCHAVILDGVEVIGDAQRSTDLVLAAIALADGAGLVEIDHEFAAQVVADLYSLFRKLLREGKHRSLVGRDDGGEMEHHAGVVLLCVDNFLVIRFAQQREYGSVESVGGLYYIGNELLVRLGIEVVHFLTAVFLMSRQVEVRSVVGAVYLAPAEREEELYVACGFRVVGELLMVVEAQMLGSYAEILKILLAELLEVVVELIVRALLAEGLELHLLELYRSEGEVAGGYLVSERLADLTDAEGQLRSHRTLDVEEVYIFTLCVFGAQIDNALCVVGDSAVGLEHEVEFSYVREIVLAAVGAGDRMSLDVLKHLLFRHLVGVGVGIKVLDERVRSVAHLALLAVEKRVGEAGDMAACLPDSRMHENVRVNFVAVSALLNESLAPGVLDIVLHSCAERAVIPGVRKSAVDVAAGENETSVFTQSDDFFHCFFGII